MVARNDRVRHQQGFGDTLVLALPLGVFQNMSQSFIGQSDLSALKIAQNDYTTKPHLILPSEAFGGNVLMSVLSRPYIGTMCWPNNADIDPDVVYALVTDEPIASSIKSTYRLRGDPHLE